MLNYQTSIQLTHTGDCRFLGIGSDMTLYVEEIYGEDDWLAQHVLTFTGTLHQTVDEDSGRAAGFTPLVLPDNLHRPARIHKTQALNFSGPRLRGQRALERIDDLVRPLTMPTRMQLIQQLKLDILPPLLLGVAESRVIAEALLLPPDTYLVCRRLRLAYGLPAPRLDSSNMPYDYDTVTLFVAHTYESTSGEIELPPEIVFSGLPGVNLRRPLDCMVHEQHLLVADGGDDSHPGQIHIWKIGP
jgi:hypothetical protein